MGFYHCDVEPMGVEKCRKWVPKPTCPRQISIDRANGFEEFVFKYWFPKPPGPQTALSQTIRIQKTDPDKPPALSPMQAVHGFHKKSG